MNVKYFITSYDPEVFDYFGNNRPSMDEIYALEGYIDALCDLFESSQMSIALEAEDAPKNDEQTRADLHQKEQERQDQAKKEEKREQEAEQKVDQDKAENDAKDRAASDRDNSVWGGIKKSFMKIIEWITGGSGRLFDILNQLDEGLTLEIHDISTAVFAYKLDKHYDSLEKMQIKMHEVLEHMDRLLIKYDKTEFDKMVLAEKEVRNIWDVQWGGEGFLGHKHKNEVGAYNNSGEVTLKEIKNKKGEVVGREETYEKKDKDLIEENTSLKKSAAKVGQYNAEAIKAYEQNGEVIRISAGILKQRCRAIRNQFKNYKPAVEKLTHEDNLEKIEDKSARSAFLRCGTLVSKIALKITVFAEAMLKYAREYLTSHFDSNSNLKKQALLSKDFEKVSGYTVYYIPKRIFPSTWYFDGSEEDDLSQRLIKAHQERGGGDGDTACFIIANREVNKKMSTKGVNFIMQHEIGHAREFISGDMEKLGGGDEAEYRADAYAKEKTGYDVPEIRKIFDRALELVESGYVKGVNLKKAKILFDNRTIKLGGDFDEKLKPKKKGEKTSNGSENRTKTDDDYDAAAWLGF